MVPQNTAKVATAKPMIHVGAFHSNRRGIRDRKYSPPASIDK